MNIQRTYISLLLLVLCMGTKAQNQLCICRGDSCDVLESRHVGTIVFAGHRMRIDSLPAYDVGRIDSIVFTRPRLANTELGWWGELAEGTSRCEARIDDAVLGCRYHATYRFMAHGGLCTAASCIIRFDSEEQKSLFFKEQNTESTSEGRNDPYIYVKETLTGPRRFEVWVMASPLLPVGTPLFADSGPTELRADLSSMLTGRPMHEVRLIVEAWLYAPLIQKDNPDYHEEP